MLPQYSTACNTMHYITFICNEIVSYFIIFHSLTFSFPLPPPVVPSDRLTNTFCSLSHYIYVYVYIRPYTYLYLHLTYRFSFHIWGKTCNLWLFEPGLLSLTWSKFHHSFTCEQHAYILLYAKPLRFLETFLSSQKSLIGTSVSLSKVLTKNCIDITFIV
jgi:hypothetical protein